MDFISKNKDVLRFLAVFASSYICLYVLYAVYLNFSSSPDFFTSQVSKQTISLLNSIGYNTTSVTNESNGFINLFTNGENVAGIAEGCNAISIMILFIAFILAFAKKAKETILYGLLGIVIIHLINICRIIILIICIYHYQEYSEPLHSIVFPGIIYGAVFLLWVFWVKSFQKTT